MGLFLNARSDAWMDGVTVAGQDLRLELASAFLTGQSPSGTTGIAARPGVRYAPASPLLVQASSGMNVSINAGTCWVQGSAAANAGLYTVCLDTTGTVTVATADPTNPRIDNVIAQVTDNGNNTSTTVITLQTGTAAPSPVAPTLPANSLLLAQIAVAAGTSSIVAGNITDKRVYTVASGGVLPVPSISGGITGPAGHYAHDLTTGRLWVADGAGNAAQPKVGAFAAVTAQNSGTVPSGVNTYAALVSTSITVDGATEIELFCQWCWIAPASTVAVGEFLQLEAKIDSTVLLPAPFVVRFDSTSSNANDGGSFRVWTTPAAGTHTVTFQASTATSGANPASVFRPFLRVAPSLQQ